MMASIKTIHVISCHAEGEVGGVIVGTHLRFQSRPSIADKPQAIRPMPAI